MKEGIIIRTLFDMTSRETIKSHKLMMCKSLVLIAFAVVMKFASASAQHLSEVGLGYSGTSVNTTIFRCNSIVSHGGWQFVAYYDSTAAVVIGKRKLGSDRWELTRTQYKGNVKDAHNVISIMVDGDGYIHLAFDHHGHPLRYCRSVAPLSTEMGQLMQMTGSNEDNVTYPEFYRLADGDLLYVYRDGSSGNGNMVMNHYSVKEKKWKRVQTNLIDGEGKRNAYWQMCVDKAGVIHVAWVWRESASVNTNHDMCYARSYDKGRTWQRSDGTPYSLPINVGNAEYAIRIPQNSELINQTSICADSHGNPYIATYWRAKGETVPQYRIIWHDGLTWQTQQVSKRTTQFSLNGVGTKMIPISRPKVAICGGEIYYIFRDVERDSKVSVAVTENMKPAEWRIKDLTDFSVNSWEPSIDSELLKQGRLHIYVQNTAQGDGEKVTDMKPQPVYVLEINN